jgi:SAM-dependent methyltransferase
MIRRPGSSSPSPAGVLTPELADAIGARMSVQSTLERIVAIGYGWTYDAIVRGFTPYEALLDDIETLIARSEPTAPPRDTRVLDISCGIGTVAGRLARRGYTVVGVDAVDHLVAVARNHYRDSGLSLSFRQLDLAHAGPPEAGTFDVLVSMHTLYWHSDPKALLLACRRVLKPGGHAIILTYSRRARIGRVFAQVRARQGWREAFRALRWLAPTALFEALRNVEARYLSPDEFHQALAGAGFEILESRDTFLAGISQLAWVRAGSGPNLDRRGVIAP